MMKHLLALATAAVVLTAAPVEQAEAREFRDIVKPYYDRYGKWQNVRKQMRKRLKNGETFTGDDWFALASVCAIKPPDSGSIILNLANKSPCRKQTVEYFINAAQNGTPRGYLQASKWTELLGGNPREAWTYAALAYRFSARDPDLMRDARSHVSALGFSPTEADLQTVNRTAMQLVANGVYPGDGPSGDVRLADLSGPDLSWLDFKNPGRCQYGDGWRKLMEDSMSYDERTNNMVPSTATIPGTSTRVKSRFVSLNRSYGDEIRVETDFKGQWQGLTVLGTFLTFIQASDGFWGDGIRFAEPVDVVAKRLSELGFVVNLDGSERQQVDKVLRSRFTGPSGRTEIAEDIDGVITQIVRKNGQTYFYCDEVFNASYGA